MLFNQKNIVNLKKTTIKATLLLLSLAYFQPVFAEGETPVAEGAQYIINAMTGTTGLALATLSIIGIGLLCLGHYLEWKRLLQTVIGVTIIFGARAIVEGIQGLVSFH